MNRLFIALSLLAIGASANADALYTFQFTGNSPNTAPPGLVYFDGMAATALDFEAHFRIDSALLAQSRISDYRCIGEPTPSGHWLFDRHPFYNGTGHYMVTVAPDGRLCFADRPDFAPATTFEFPPLPLDTCLIMTARRTGDDLVVTVGDETRTRSTPSVFATYRSGPNGIGVGREINGYHSWSGNDSFPGEISYIRDGSIEPIASGQLTGGAYRAASACDASPPAPAPDPDPVPTACDIDPTSFACACETSQWPECSYCQAPAP